MHDVPKSEAQVRYGDIIDLSRPRSARASMPIADRAAQFSPFAALTGHEDAVQEAGRYVEERIALGEAEREELDRQLAEIRRILPQKPHVVVTRFVEDALKDGGTCATHEGRVRAFDDVSRALIFEDGAQVPLSDILSLTRMPTP